jgi:16S rRNA (guanine527-N7)-methyltransferase
VSQPEFVDSLEQDAFEALRDRFNVSRETLSALSDYQALLKKWAKQINLVGPSTIGHFWSRHVLDCAQLLPVTDQHPKTVVDFGSGAGLPGLILAVLLKERSANTHVTLIELSPKRCAFLREAARTLGVHVTILQQDIATITPNTVDLITARAFAPLDKLLTYAFPWAQLGGRILFLKGEDVQAEIEKASTNWTFQSRVTQSLTDSRGCILEISKLQPLEGA